MIDLIIVLHQLLDVQFFPRFLLPKLHARELCGTPMGVQSLPALHICLSDSMNSMGKALPVLQVGPKAVLRCGTAKQERQ